MYNYNYTIIYRYVGSRDCLQVVVYTTSHFCIDDSLYSSCICESTVYVHVCTKNSANFELYNNCYIHVHVYTLTRIVDIELLLLHVH